MQGFLLNGGLRLGWIFCLPVDRPNQSEEGKKAGHWIPHPGMGNGGEDGQQMDEALKAGQQGTKDMLTATATSHPGPQTCTSQRTAKRMQQKHTTRKGQGDASGSEISRRCQPEESRRKPPTSCGPTKLYQCHSLQYTAMSGERVMELGSEKEGFMHMMRWGTQEEPQLTFHGSLLIHQKLVRVKHFECMSICYAWGSNK
mmetsp:Transcript_5883/g.10603  ORF Transcript_5883/g.10603 Transcript_5883/m.10603 type:complete len:200 (-) Transcript_5883:505-1104(-)